MSCLKLQVSFSLNCASLFSVMRGNSSVLFKPKLYMSWTKEAHQSAKFQTFNCSRKSPSNLYFDRLLLLKVYKIIVKKVQRSSASWPWRVVQNLKKNWFFVSKMTRIWWILTQAVGSLKKFHLDWFLLCKAFNVCPRKLKRSYISWYWRLVSNLKKNWLVVWKMTWEI